jgi:hypothetical protein
LTLLVKGTQTVTWKAPNNASVLCATLLPGNLGAASAGGSIFLFDTDTGKTVARPLRGHFGSVTALAPAPDGRYLLSAGIDMTLRIWNLDQARAAKPGEDVQPMLSFFFSEGRSAQQARGLGQEPTSSPRSWVAWTPEGYYAASPDGERFVGWRKDNGPDKLATFYPAEQFRKSLYQPAALKEVVEHGSLEEALKKVVVKTTDKTKGVTPVSEVLPPTVDITGFNGAPPKNGLLLKQPDLTVEATATSPTGYPVTSMQLQLDARPYGEAKRVDAAKPGQPVTQTWTLKVPPDKHRLSVVASTEKSDGRSDEVYVKNVATAPMPKLFVLAIGVNAYENPGLQKLERAVKDAKGLAEAFQKYSKGKKDLFGDVNIRLLTDKDATRQGILDALDKLPNDKDKDKDQVSDDVAVIFFSGHGDRDDKGDFYLMSVDANPKDMARTAVAGAELKKKLAALPYRHVTLLLDACHSGAIGTDDLTRDLKQPDCGVMVFCAATSDEFSRENAEIDHGYFTKAMIDGLSGEAGKNTHGEVTVSRLALYVEEKVPELTDNQQHPVVGRPTSIRPFALAKP